MTSLERHLAKFRLFREAAFNPSVPEELRVEAMFLAAFHLIDARAAAEGVHINKHQRLRRELERSGSIFGAATRRLWTAFQELERDLRPKFVYGGTWKRSDFTRAEAVFRDIEDLCGGGTP